jgi:hypothetical protein
MERAQALEQARLEAQANGQPEPVLPEVPPENLEGWIQAQLTLQPPEQAPLVVETATFSLSPDKTGWLSVLGFAGYGGDPEKVMDVAATRVQTLVLERLPGTNVLLPTFLDAVRHALVGQGQEQMATALLQDGTILQALETGLQVLESVFRATITVTAGDLETSIQWAADSTVAKEDEEVEP